MLDSSLKSFHKNVTETLKRYACADCNKTYKNKCHLLRHQKHECEVIDRPRLICEVCHKSYKTRRDLGRHQRYECQKEPQFHCPECPYKARLKSGYELTQRYACSNCSKTYKNKGHLTRHQTYECSKVPQFQCPQCPYRTKRKCTLKTHIGIKHWPFI
ncbi:hypothetical protein O3M35_011206 [Rhynocoris fuscipes]|uniref:C2H2-type domain-containing protein n=1 Tax=Rhynocoris fuscipes TaxID=488301 RepID=A0AAW1CXL9_9HEMI